jgi:glycerol transport system ATP-binding protein
LDVFRRPATLEAARAFSDPPINLIPGRIDSRSGEMQLTDGSRLHLPSTLVARLPPIVTLGLRAHHLALAPRETTQCSFDGVVQLAEISGSETYVHVSAGGTSLIAQMPGVHQFVLGQACTLYFSPKDLHCFDVDGNLLVAAES